MTLHSADLRSRPARVPQLPRPDAHHCLHHATVGDRPDPHASPHACGARHPRRYEEPPTTRAPATRGASRAPRPSADARTAPSLRTPRRPLTARGHSACEALPPAPQTGPRRVRPPTWTEGPAALAAPKRARRPAAARRGAMARSITPYGCRVPDEPRLKFLSRRKISQLMEMRSRVRLNRPS